MRPNYSKLIFAVSLTLYFLWITYDPMQGSFLDNVDLPIHEFGHLLGFPDGYIRGYKDLGETGLQIEELTTVYDDIMSSPRDGAVLPAHFKMIMEAVKQRSTLGQ